MKEKNRAKKLSKEIKELPAYAESKGKSNKELLQAYFDKGGLIYPNGRIGEVCGNINDPEDAIVALSLLESRKKGRRLLTKTTKKFRKGEIDKYGREIKKEA